MMPLTEYQKELVTNNHELIFGCAKKMNLPFDDYYDILAIGLCKAAKIYDNSKGMFSTVAYACMKNEIKLYWIHEQRKRAIPANMILSYDVQMTDDMEPENSGAFSDVLADDFSVDETVTSKMVVEEIISRFNEKEKEIVEYLQDGLTFKEIGEIMHCTKQNIGYIVHGMRNKCARYAV